MVHRILVVEDEPSIQLVIRKSLSKIGGYEVIVSEDVDEGLALARAGQVSLIVMDVSLSNSRQADSLIDGLTFTRLLKADPQAQRVPVLLATAHAMPGDAERLCAASGADGYIAKPFATPNLLVDKVREMIEKFSA